MAFLEHFYLSITVLEPFDLQVDIKVTNFLKHLHSCTVKQHTRQLSFHAAIYCILLFKEIIFAILECIGILLAGVLSWQQIGIKKLSKKNDDEVNAKKRRKLKSELMFVNAGMDAI